MNLPYKVVSSNYKLLRGKVLTSKSIRSLIFINLDLNFSYFIYYIYFRIFYIRGSWTRTANAESKLRALPLGDTFIKNIIFYHLGGIEPPFPAIRPIL